MVTETTQEDHGFIVVAAPSDWLFAKGCIASIRHFMPNVPLTLLIDGEIDLGNAPEVFSFRTLIRDEIQNPWLRSHSFGWAITKMNVFWESPYEHFVAMDSDMIVWGDIREKVFKQQADFVWSMPGGAAPNDVDAYVNRWFFDPLMFSRIGKEFPWREYVRYFVCPGVYSATRGLLPLERYQELLNFNLTYPGSFKFGDMGIVNVMAFEAVHKHALKLAFEDFQVIFPDHKKVALEQRFKFTDSHPVVNKGDEQVLHMTDSKPLMESEECYSTPMTFFRLKFLEKTAGLVGLEAVRRLRAEDEAYRKLRKERLRSERNAKILGLVRGDVAAWRRVALKLKLLQAR